MSPRSRCTNVTARIPRVVAAALAVAVGATGCGGDDSSGGRRVDDPAAAAAAALDAGIATSETTASTDGDAPVQLDPTSIRGEIIDQYTLELEDCFDRIEDLRAGRPVIVTTKLLCDDPHGFQVYARLIYPAEHPSTYPGDEVMIDFALQSCYQRFEAWVGTSYELSELDIAVLTPNRENFEDNRARYRGIHCWVEHVDGEPLVGSMRGSSV